MLGQDSPQEWFPWKSGADQDNFGRLFVNVTLCLVPGVCVIAIRFSFWIARILCGNRYRQRKYGRKIRSCQRVRDSISPGSVAGTAEPIILRDKSLKQIHATQGLSMMGSNGAEGGTFSPYVVKKPWSEIRVLVGFGFCALSLVLFIAFMLASQTLRSEPYEMPWRESLGFLALAASSFSITSFYRSGIQYSREFIPNTRFRPTPILMEPERLWIFRLCWTFLMISSAIRMTTLSRNWLSKRPTYTLKWRILLMLGFIVQTIIVLVVLVLSWFLKDERECSETLLKEPFPHIVGANFVNGIETTESSTPEEFVGVFKTITFEWLSSLVWAGRKKQLEIRDVYSIRTNLKAAILYARFFHFWTKNLSKRTQKYVLINTLWKYVRPRFLTAALCKLLYDSVLVMDPLFLHLLVSYMTDG